MSDAVELFLKEAIGLHSGTIGSSVIDHAIKQRMNACGITDIQIYRQHLVTSDYERQELINAVVVPETWFFRDREAFGAAVQHLRNTSDISRPKRILSLPCSSGEEPFSMAISLFEAGFGAEDFRIDAVDVSTQNLEKAERAIYGRNSFRGSDLGLCASYFDNVDVGLQPNDRVRGQVAFTRANLFEWAPVLGEHGYDVILCRNLLIYFDRQTQERALRRLGGWLAPNGLLLVGPGESGIPTTCGYASVRAPRAFAFRKADRPQMAPAAVLPLQSSLAPRPAAPAGSPKPKPTAAAGKAAVKPFGVPRTAMPESAVSSADRAAASLAAIERAANTGRMTEARQAAAAHFADFGPSADIFYLMGLICDASGETSEAIQHYRKALYLAPDHAETLAHLALLLQSRGDISAAKALNSRLAKLEQRRSGS
ncbi:methyltransferase [Labrys miyagiensis]|uniref:Methyltransferase n=1 Tax=Labrys miyagiensis TaxID=346912 RepID=A0ABQ6CP10_9HYPH|nr:CheR family methyltransferase [Labrys miyagiensis]GLS21875.1 methyltransferase [Labrys miyagiensis]